MILETLPNSFILFKRNYVLNKMDINLTTLMTKLQTFECMINSKGGGANMVVASSSSSKKKKKISDKRKALLKVKKKGSKNEKKATKGGKCFHCGKKGHWKRNSKGYLDSVKPKEGMVLVLETSLVEKSNNFWIIDSGATNNICTSLQGLQVLECYFML